MSPAIMAMCRRYRDHGHTPCYHEYCRRYGYMKRFGYLAYRRNTIRWKKCLVYQPAAPR